MQEFGCPLLRTDQLMIDMVGLRGPIMIRDGIRDNTCSGLLDHTMHLKSFAILLKIDRFVFEILQIQ